MKSRVKSIVILAMSLILLVSGVSTVMAAEVKDGWYYETVESSGREGWRYYKSGEVKALKWIYNTDTGIWNYLDAEGIMTTGWGEGYAEGSYFDEDGTMVTGWHYLMAPASVVPDSTVLPTSNIVEASSPTEEAEYSGWYYFKQDGVMAAGWQKIDEAWYYFADYGLKGFCPGQMVRGRVSLEGNQYYFDDETGAMLTGFVEYAGDLYYYSTVGMMKKDSWIKVSGGKYYAGSDGKLYTGKGSGNVLVKEIDGDTYAFDADGRVITSRTIYLNGDRWSTVKPSAIGDYNTYQLSSGGVGTAGTYVVK